MFASLQGYRTYIIVVVGVLVTAYTTLSMTFGWPPIPDSVTEVLGFLGLGALRAAVNK